MFFILFSLLLIYKNIIDFYVYVLYTEILLNSHINIACRFFWIFYIIPCQLWRMIHSFFHILMPISITFYLLVLNPKFQLVEVISNHDFIAQNIIFFSNNLSDMHYMCSFKSVSKNNFLNKKRLRQKKRKYPRRFVSKLKLLIY